MSDVSELIYETCKAYLIQQGKFLLMLEVFIGTVMVAYFWLIGLEAYKIAIVLLFSLIGIGGSYGVAWYGIRINTLANSPHRLRQPARPRLPGVRHPAARRA